MKVKLTCPHCSCSQYYEIDPTKYGVDCDYCGKEIGYIVKTAKELTVDFICQKLGDYLDSPCNFSFATEELRDACKQKNPAECWRKYFELAFINEERNKVVNNISELSSSFCNNWLADGEQGNTADDKDVHSLLKCCTDPETGDVHQTKLLQLLDELNANRTKTREDLGRLYEDSLSDADAYEAEKEHFAKLEKVAARTADALRYMLETLIYYGNV